MTKHYTGLVYSIVVLMLFYTAASSLPGPKSVFLNLRQASLGRSDEKIIEKDSYENEPVEIENLAVKNISISLHQKFSARSLAEHGGGEEEDWLENLEFTVKNKSDKRITYLAISLRFPLSGDTDRSVGMFYHFVFGIDLRASGQAATYADPFSLDSGASYTIRLSEKGLKEIKDRVAMSKRSLGDLNKVFLRISVVGSEDGLLWQDGKYSKPEKHKQSDEKVIEIARQESAPCEIADLGVKSVKITPQEKIVPSGFRNVLTDSYEFSAKSVAKSGGGLEEDWLENLEFAINNKSNKQITYIRVTIDFPETIMNGPKMVSNLLLLGRHPNTPENRLKESTPLALAAGNKITFLLSAQKLKLIKDFLAHRKFKLAELNNAKIVVDTLIFEDGIMWYADQYFKPSSDAPGRYVRIDQ